MCQGSYELVSSNQTNPPLPPLCNSRSLNEGNILESDE